VHPITCSLGLPTRHFDVQFVGRAPAGSVPVISSESDDLRWFDVDDLPSGISPELPVLIERAVRRVASSRADASRADASRADASRAEGGR
jgi:hypothetical protein